jgi:hypothetical protein
MKVGSVMTTTMGRSRDGKQEVSGKHVDGSSDKYGHGGDERSGWFVVDRGEILGDQTPIR